MRYLVVATVSACSFSPGLPEAPADSARDGTVFDDAPLVPSDGCVTFSSQTNTCTASFTVPMTITSNKIYNTDTHVLADYPGGANPVTLGANQQTNITGMAGALNVFLTTTFELKGGVTLRVVGSKAFGIMASDMVTIGGLIDAGSVAELGAGAWDAIGCGTATPAKPPNHGLDANHGGAPGGGGGAFRGTGGDGGDSDSNETPGTGFPGGLAIATPLGPRGGCPGGPGSSSTNTTGAGGAGGGGGGAVYIVSQTLIKVNGGGAIGAGGGGGGGGNNTDGGGGGGGSGGMILLEAPVVDVDGNLAANGGAGGGGAGGATAGSPGEAGQPDDGPATGGNAASNATEGAPGSAGATIEGPDNDLPRESAAGGGGGGGAGYTAIKSPAPNIAGGAKISPPLTPWP